MLPAQAVAVVKGGEVSFAKGYGMADLEHDVPITPRTAFYIGSVTKQFTAFAIVKLVQEGQLTLDDDLRKHLPELHDFARIVTIRHLIHHTSGLRDHGGLGILLGGFREGQVVTQKEALGLLRGQRELNFPPGEEHLYCNSNYTLLATIVERVIGQSYRDWMAKNVFAPLGMTRTDVGDDLGRVIKGRAFSYAPQPGEKVGFKTVVAPITAYGDGGIYSTAEDLSRWLANFDKPRAGDAAVMAQMAEPGKLIGRRSDRVCLRAQDPGIPWPQAHRAYRCLGGLHGLCRPVPGPRSRDRRPRQPRLLRSPGDGDEDCGARDSRSR